MAFRNSVKAACLSLDNEQPGARVDEAGEPVKSWHTWEEETRALVAALPGKIHLDEMQLDMPAMSAPADMPAMPAPAAVAPPVSETQQTEDEAFLASSWHTRAETLRAMTDTLPSKITRSLMPKIAAIYDDFARDAGGFEPDTLATPDPLAPPDALPSDDLAHEPERDDLAPAEALYAVAPAPQADEPDVEVKPQPVALPEPQPEQLGFDEKPQAVALPELEPEESGLAEKPQALAPEPALDRFDGEEERQALAPPIVPRAPQRAAFPRRSPPRRRG